MDLKWQGKVALVAAASKGLGRASAMEIAREGGSVAICGRDGASIEATAAEIRQATGARVLSLVADVAKVDDCNGFVAEAVREFGRIDALVVNAGGPPGGSFADMTDAHWEQGFQLTLMSAVRLIRAALPHLEAAGGGRIVCISSTSIKQPVDRLILSNSLRAAVQGMIKSLADEVAPKGILINSVAPGRFETDRVRSLDQDRAERAGISREEQQARTAKNSIPLGRYGQPEEFGRYVAFLASPANTYVTGQSLMVDGGMVRGV